MDRESWVYKARLSEKAERYSDMMHAVQQIILLGDDINADERNLFSVAYKNGLASKRLAWRTVSMVEQAEENECAQHLLDSIRNYRQDIEKEIDSLCHDVLNLLDKNLLPKAQTPEAKVYFLKMKADYYRYLAEIVNGEERKELAENATVSYKEASEIASAELPPTDPIRLGLALNFSVFFYEILNSTDKACRLARAAFDDAVAELDMLSEETYKDATLIMQLLRDNLTLWSDNDGTSNPQNVEDDVNDA